MRKQLTRIFAVCYAVILVLFTVYAAVTLLCFAFGQIYEYFGFGVKSAYMHFAFLIPLGLGLLPRLVMLFAKKKPVFSDAGLVLWRLGIATLIIGSLFRGALDIYGTQSGLTVAYPVAGIVLLIAASTIMSRIVPVPR